VFHQCPSSKRWAHAGSFLQLSTVIVTVVFQYVVSVKCANPTTSKKKANRRMSNVECRRVESLALRRRLRRVSLDHFKIDRIPQIFNLQSSIPVHPGWELLRLTPNPPLNNTCQTWRFGK
jgi:hypothetical protein